MKINTFMAGINTGVLISALFVMFNFKVFVWWFIPIILLNIFVIIFNLSVDREPTPL